MFTFPNKRQREPDGPGFEDITAQRKRHRALPLRTFPNTSQDPSCDQPEPYFRPPTLTPVESSDEDDAHTKQSSSAFDDVSDTAMDVDTGKEVRLFINGDDLSPWDRVEYDHNKTQQSSIPGSLVNQSLNINGVASQAFSHASTTMASIPASTSPNATKNQGFPWHPRLPSPISDAGSSKGPASDVEMSLSRPASPQFDTHAIHDRHVESAASRRKVAFSMGYRADCDKCRQRVPGHYSHIIRI